MNEITSRNITNNKRRRRRRRRRKRKRRKRRRRRRRRRMSSASYLLRMVDVLVQIQQHVQQLGWQRRRSECDAEVVGDVVVCRVADRNPVGDKGGQEELFDEGRILLRDLAE
jgi:hypothetical protein